MKLSLMTYMAELSLLRCRPEETEEKKKEFASILKAAHDAGFTRVDVTGKAIFIMGEEKTKELFCEYNLSLCCLNCMAPFADTALSDEEAFLVIRKNADLAASFGAKKMMLIPDRVNGSRKEVGECLKRRFGLAVEYAAPLGITCGFEDDPRIDMPMCSCEELKEMLAAVPGLKLIYDTANVLMVHEDPEEDFRQLVSETVHIHLKDMGPVPLGAPFSALSRQGVPLANRPHGKGSVDFPAFFACAYRLGYQDTMTLEYTAEPGVSFEEAFCFLHRYFNEIGEAAGLGKDE